MSLDVLILPRKQQNGLICARQPTTIFFVKFDRDEIEPLLNKADDFITAVEKLIER